MGREKIDLIEFAAIDDGNSPVFVNKNLVIGLTVYFHYSFEDFGLHWYFTRSEKQIIGTAIKCTNMTEYYVIEPIEVVKRKLMRRTKRKEKNG